MWSCGVRNISERAAEGQYSLVRITTEERAPPATLRARRSCLEMYGGLWSAVARHRFVTPHICDKPRVIKRCRATALQRWQSTASFKHPSNIRQHGLFSLSSAHCPSDSRYVWVG